MKIMSIKDHVHSSINDFCEIIKAITNTSFVGNEEEQLAFLQFSENHYSCVFYVLFKSIAVYGSTCCFLKRPITSVFGSSKPLHLLRLMGMSVPSLHIQSTDCMILHNPYSDWIFRSYCNLRQVKCFMHEWMGIVGR